MRQLLILSFCFFPFFLHSQDGTFDQRFAAGGKLVYETDRQPFDHALSVVQKDGKILVAGTLAETGNFNQFTLLRLLADGTPDQSFGNGGTATVHSSSPQAPDFITGLVVQKDGKIVISGTIYKQLNSLGSLIAHFATIRLLPNGSLDQSFNVTGKVLADMSTVAAHTQAMALQPDGKIIVAGGVNLGISPDEWDAVLIRYRPDGSLDPTFGVNGKVVSIPGNFRGENILSLAFQPDGRIIGSGWVSASGSSRFALFRYTITGRLDSSFGGSGIVMKSASSNSQGGVIERLEAVKVLKDGNFITVGRYIPPQQQQQFVKQVALRFKSDGSLDSSFGTNGLSTLADYGSLHDLLVQKDGKVIAVGALFPTPQPTGSKLMAVRFNQNGSVDQNFGTNGKTIIGGNGISKASCDFQDSNILVVTALFNSVEGDWLIARLNNSVGPEISPLSMQREITLFPNPGKAFQLRFMGYEERVKIIIYDAAGRLYHQQDNEVVDQILIDVKTQLLASGIYFVVIHTAEGTITKRFIKQ